jgi:hypothetical protein
MNARNMLENLANITELVEHNGGYGELRNVFLLIDDFAGLDYYVDRYYDEFCRLFYLDSSCCNAVPYHDEIVFHFRNFVKEMPRRAVIKGYEELTP